MHHFTGLVVICDENNCSKSKVFSPVEGSAPSVMEKMARDAGWYVASYFGGPDLCPSCHTLRAQKAGLDSLYKDPICDLPAPALKADKKMKKVEVGIAQEALL